MKQCVIAILSFTLALPFMGPPAGAVERPLTAERAFHTVVRPFITAHCSSCHNPEKKKGKLSLDDLSGVIVKEKNADLWATILDQLEHEDMPPAEAKRQPDGKVRKRVMDWIRAELGHAGFERDPDLLSRPEFGNHISHEKLFSGGVKSPSFSAPRVWRMRAGLMKSGNPFPRTDVDYAAMQVVDEPMTLRLRALSETIADQMMPYLLGKKKVERRRHKNAKAVQAFGVPKLSNPGMYLGRGAIDRGKVERDIVALFETFVSRKPIDAERKRYADFLEGMLKSETDRVACLATAIRAIVLTPESMYRMELGLGERLKDGRRMLSADELAIAVPMALGRSDAVAGLKTREDVERALRRIIKQDLSTNGPSKTPHGISPRFLDFMRWYFGYDRATEVFKGERRHRHAAAAELLVEETDRLVVSILREDKDVFRRLLTFDEVIVSRRTGGKDLAHVLQYYKPTLRYGRGQVEGTKADRKTFLAAYRVFEDLSYMNYYNLEPDSKLAASTDKRDVIQSPVPRAGVLTQPSWLQAHSTFTDNHVVLRGKWVREKLLGGSIPEVPVGVDAAIPDDEEKSIRERLKSTRGEFCWRCHHRMDPLGYPFEMYDDFGSYRANKRERFINGKLDTKPLDTTGEIIASGAAGLDGPVKDAVEMIRKIAETDRARQVFIRHVFRFFMGRNETLNDAQTLIRADEAYRKSGGSFTELVVSILTSDSFLYRRDPT